MFDVGWQELGLIAVVALVVLGPEELPVMMRKAGHFMRKAKLVAHDLRMNLEEMADVAELREIEREAYKKAVAIEPATADHARENLPPSVESKADHPLEESQDDHTKPTPAR